MLRGALEDGSVGHGYVFIQNHAFEAGVFPDHRALHDDAGLDLGAGGDADVAEDDAVFHMAEDAAAVGDQAILDLAPLSVVGGDFVAHFGIDRALAAKQPVAHLFFQEGEAVGVVAAGILIAQNDALEGIGEDPELLIVELALDIIPLQMHEAAGRGIVDGVDKLAAGEDEHAHTDERALVGGRIEAERADLTVFLGFEHQRMAAAIGLAVGHDRDVGAGLDMLLDGGAEIDVAQDGGIADDHDVVVGVIDKAHGGIEGFELALIDAHIAAGKRRQDDHALVFAVEVPIGAVAEMVHQGAVVVFCDDSDVVNPGIGHAGEDKIDLPVAAAEGKGGDRAVVGQLAEAAVVDIGKDHAHRFHFGALLSRFPWGEGSCSVRPPYPCRRRRCPIYAYRRIRGNRRCGRCRGRWRLPR